MAGYSEIRWPEGLRLVLIADLVGGESERLKTWTIGPGEEIADVEDTNKIAAYLFHNDLIEGVSDAPDHPDK